MNTLVTIPKGLNNLKIKEDDLDVDKFKTISVDLKKLSDIVSKEVAKIRCIINKIQK